MATDNTKLAILGGSPIIKKQFKKYNSIGLEEMNASIEVLKTGVLSKYIGADHEDFNGGPKVKEFERDLEKFYSVKHAITVNSWTSGLIVAIGSLDLEPGDEVIVPCWTMCATATAILHWNLIPVFADIELSTYNIDIDSIKKNISHKTKAIMAVDIGGHPCDINSIKKIADEHDLKIICDSAQSPGATYKGKLAGTVTDIGGFSLNYHKHIHTGEGGILVTNNDHLAERMRLIRNHGEAAVEGRKTKNINNIIGYNFRLGEIECAIGIEQLKKLKGLINTRQKIAEKITKTLQNLKGIITPTVFNSCTHVYYMYFMQLEIDKLGVSRDAIYDALEAEGVQGLAKKFANLHLLPMYQKKIAYGKNGFPWTAEFARKEVSYEKGICPNAELLHDKTYLGFQMCMFEMDDEEVELLLSAFKKVWNNLDKIK
tara:strand:+ start:497 stop:1783 length:1287 start_codon:yes stop_codon:yes gene_type:complete